MEVEVARFQEERRKTFPFSWKSSILSFKKGTHFLHAQMKGNLNTNSAVCIPVLFSYTHYGISNVRNHLMYIVYSCVPFLCFTSIYFPNILHSSLWNTSYPTTPLKLTREVRPLENSNRSDVLEKCSSSDANNVTIFWFGNKTGLRVKTHPQRNCEFSFDNCKRYREKFHSKFWSSWHPTIWW